MATTTAAAETQVSQPIELSPVPPRAYESGGRTLTDLEQPDEARDAEPEGEPHLDRKTLLRIISAAFSFLVAGSSDGSIGALIPYMIRTHHINTAIVSSIYGASFGGWLFAAVTNTHISQYLDLGPMLALGACCQILAQVLRCWNPPFGLFVVTFWIVCVGQAFQDTHANTFVSSVKGAHRWLGFIHAMYMAGCLIGPFVSTAVASAGKVSHWYLYYTFPLGLGIINLCLVVVAFWDTFKFKRTAKVEESVSPQPVERPVVENPEGSKNKGAMTLIKKTLSMPSFWIMGMFYFFYLGAALTASGWVVEYLVQVRHGELSHMGYVPAGFSGGCLISRLLLAEPTHRFGEKRMVLSYIILACVFQLVFWLVPNIIAASIAVSFVGFFTGPLFAAGISLGSKLFQEEIRPTALAFVFVVAQMGGSLFPVITGVVASHVGVSVLQPILVALLVAAGVTWLLIPRPKASSNTDLHQE